MNKTNQNRHLKRRKLFRAVFGIFSLSGIMFAFQACYGTPQDFGMDVLIKGKVTSAATKASLPGIKVQVSDLGQYATTASDGTYAIYCERMPEFNLLFSDTDGALNGEYQACDTTVQVPDEAEEFVFNIELK
jgi:hypothetical protein